MHLPNNLNFRWSGHSTLRILLISSQFLRGSIRKESRRRPSFTWGNCFPMFGDKINQRLESRGITSVRFAKKNDLLKTLLDINERSEYNLSCWEIKHLLLWNIFITLVSNPKLSLANFGIFFLFYFGKFVQILNDFNWIHRCKVMVYSMIVYSQKCIFVLVYFSWIHDISS